MFDFDSIKGHGEIIKEWDENDDIFRCEFSDGFKAMIKIEQGIYTVKGLSEEHYIDSDGREFWSRYNDNDDLIYRRMPDGTKYIYKYDDRFTTMKIKYKEDDKPLITNVYNEFGSLVHYIDLKHNVEIKNEYDERNNLIHSKTSSGYECWYEYDNEGNLVSCKDNLSPSLFKAPWEV